MAAVRHFKMADLPQKVISLAKKLYAKRINGFKIKADTYSRTILERGRWEIVF